MKLLFRRPHLLSDVHQQHAVFLPCSLNFAILANVHKYRICAHVSVVPQHHGASVFLSLNRNDRLQNVAVVYGLPNDKFRCVELAAGLRNPFFNEPLRFRRGLPPEERQPMPACGYRRRAHHQHERRRQPCHSLGQYALSFRHYAA